MCAHTSTTLRDDSAALVLSFDFDHHGGDDCDDLSLLNDQHNSVIVHGPAGCGKTSAAVYIAHHLGLYPVIDSWDESQPVVPGALHLTNIQPQTTNQTVVLTFEQTIAAMKTRTALADEVLLAKERGPQGQQMRPWVYRLQKGKAA